MRHNGSSYQFTDMLLAWLQLAATPIHRKKREPHLVHTCEISNLLGFLAVYILTVHVGCSGLQSNKTIDMIRHLIYYCFVA